MHNIPSFLLKNINSIKQATPVCFLLKVCEKNARVPSAKPAITWLLEYLWGSGKAKQTIFRKREHFCWYVWNQYTKYRADRTHVSEWTPSVRHTDCTQRLRPAEAECIRILRNKDKRRKKLCFRVKKLCNKWKRSAFPAVATFLPEFQSTQFLLSFLTKQKPDRLCQRKCWVISKWFQQKIKWHKLVHLKTETKTAGASWCRTDLWGAQHRCRGWGLWEGGWTDPVLCWTVLGQSLWFHCRKQDPKQPTQNTGRAWWTRNGETGAANLCLMVVNYDRVMMYY